jgi:hypothetical protein
LVTGCAPTRIPVSGLSGSDELNQRAVGKTVQVVLANREVIYAKSIHVSPDSLCWTSRWIGETSSGHWTDKRGSVATPDVKVVKIHRTARGVLKGLLYGGGSGLILARATHSPGLFAEAEFGLKTALGALIGIIAWGTTDEDVYEFVQRAEAGGPQVKHAGSSRLRWPAGLLAGMPPD